MTAFVYLLHFDRPHPNGQKNPRHYLGVCQDLDDRLLEHTNGSSKSRFTRSMAEHGIPFVVAKSWKFDYPKAAFDRERKIKKRKESYSHLCPICRSSTSSS